jgi:YggT family protein
MPGSVTSLILIILNILSIGIIARAIMSWFDPMGRTAIQRVLIDLTEPIIAPIRRLVPSMGMFDISPIVALIIIQVVSRLLAAST